MCNPLLISESSGKLRDYLVIISHFTRLKSNKSIRMKKLITLLSAIILSGLSTITAQTGNDIFERYPWLIANDIVDPLTCDNESIAVYEQSIYSYLLVTDVAGVATLYNQEGQFYCQNATNYDCVVAYGFSAPSETWTCGDSTCGGVSGTILFSPCNNGQLYFLVQTEDGQIYDPYIDRVPTYVPVEGQKINFSFTNANFGTPCINASKAINLSCVDIVETPELSRDCGKHTGTVFFEECAGISYYFIRTTEGEILDAYQAPGVTFQPSEGQMVSFDFYEATFATPCSQADRAAIITCIELDTPSDPTVFEDFPFLQDLVDESNCSGTSIEVYDQGPYSYIYINTGSESGQLYFEDGSFYCNTMANYDCVALYNFGAPSSTWTCGDSGIVNSETRSTAAVSKPAFTAYPNPTYGQFIIELEANNQADASASQQLLVVDALGRVILEQEVADQESSVTMDISAYQKGLYYVMLQVGDQRVVTKIVKH